MQTQDAPVREREPAAKPVGLTPWIAAVAVVVLGALVFGVWALVDSDGADELESVEAPEIVTQWGEAFVAGDPEGLAALYAEGGAFNCRAFDFTIGREEIPDVVMGDETDFTEFKPTTVLVGDEIIAVEYMVSAVSPVSGERISTPLLAVFDVDADGLIRQSTIDYDPEEMFPDMFSDASEQGLASAYQLGA